MRARTVTVFAPKYGQLRLVVTRNRHGNYEDPVRSDRTLDLTRMVCRKRSRWSIETVFRDSKQFTGLKACQCWSNQVLVRHVGLVFLTCAVLQLLWATPNESIDAAKERCSGPQILDNYLSGYDAV
ncbi:MAG: hypothetical protein M3R24_11325 [Chloroflexota bacterium]|nr:hypothetical protein [Chloroflexota bacterium]